MAALPAAGYPGTPLAAKLRMKDGMAAAFIALPVALGPRRGGRLCFGRACAGVMLKTMNIGAADAAVLK
jgi:hypothetical protein